MSNKTGFFEEALEAGKSLSKKTGKAAGDAVSDTTKTAVSQTGLPTSDATTGDIVDSLYGTGKKNPQDDTNAPQNPQTSPVKTSDDTVSPKSPQEKQQMEALRSKLHQERHDKVYYQPLISGKAQQQEERPAEKVENEKQQEMMDLQEKEKEKPPPLAVQRGQRKTEQFPGGGG